MTSQIQIQNNKVIMTIQGSIYVEEATAIREQLLSYLEKGHSRFVINLGSVDYIDSSGFRGAGGHTETGPAKWRRCGDSGYKRF